VKPSFVINNERITERRIIAQEFNKYFASIASDLNKKWYDTDLGIPVTDLPKFESFMPKRNQNSMFMFECSRDEIANIIKDYDNNIKPVIFLSES
jgi:hypothetical protein